MNQLKGLKKPKSSTKTQQAIQKIESRLRSLSTRNYRSHNETATGSVAAAYAVNQLSRVAKITQRDAHSITIVHSELLSSIIGSPTFNCVGTPGYSQFFSGNIGLSGSYPWGFTQGLGWEVYEVLKQKLRYVTRCGSGTQGSVMIACDYDAADNPPGSEQIMSTYYGCVEGPAWRDLTYTFDSTKLAGKRFIRTGALSSNLDIKTYDYGNFFIATTDASTASPWGKLWIDYEIRLSIPQFPSGGIPQNVGTLTTGLTNISYNDIWGSDSISTGNLLITHTPGTNKIYLNNLTIGLEYSISIFITALNIGSSVTITPQYSNKSNLASGTVVTPGTTTQLGYVYSSTFIAVATVQTFNIQNISSGGTLGDSYAIGCQIYTPSVF